MGKCYGVPFQWNMSPLVFESNWIYLWFSNIHSHTFHWIGYTYWLFMCKLWTALIISHWPNPHCKTAGRQFNELYCLLNIAPVLYQIWWQNRTTIIVITTKGWTKPCIQLLFCYMYTICTFTWRLYHHHLWFTNMPMVLWRKANYLENKSETNSAFCIVPSKRMQICFANISWLQVIVTCNQVSCNQQCCSVPRLRPSAPNTIHRVEAMYISLIDIQWTNTETKSFQ